MSATTGAIDYDGRRFRSQAAETSDHEGGVPTGAYHQDGDLVWAEFCGGDVVRGSLVGRVDGKGTIEFAYAQLLSSGPVSGVCTSRPEWLADGRLRLYEHWRRIDGSSGISVIEECRAPAPGAPA